MTEKQVEKEYREVVGQISRQIPGETNNFDLDLIGSRIFGFKFRGVFAADRLPELNRGHSCIANTDPSDLPGTHWIALARSNSDKIYFYDSFGRSPKKLMPMLKRRYRGKKILYDTKDKEQELDETNCGARALAWIYLFYKLGPEAVLKI